MKRLHPVVLMFTAIVTLSGCGSIEAPGFSEQAEPSKPVAPQPIESAGAASQIAEAKPPVAVEDGGIINSVSSLFGDATDATLDAANSSGEYVGELFQSLKAKGMTTATDTQQWVAEDFQAMGTWEYKVQRIAEAADVAAAETVAVELNKLGIQRWECFQVVGDLYYFKRPRKSYLRNLPMKDLIKLVPMMSNDN